MRRLPLLGIVYNVVTWGALVVLIVAMVTSNDTLVIIGGLMLVPTILWPGTPSYIAYWRQFRE